MDPLIPVKMVIGAGVILSAFATLGIVCAIFIASFEKFGIKGPLALLLFLVLSYFVGNHFFVL